MSSELQTEARRQIEICNACRYCEGYCSVFPAITRQRAFSDGDITQLANLCHNCRGCYYACQFTEPHEFALNLPMALAEVRHENWKDHAWPKAFAKAFDQSGLAIAGLLVLTTALLFALATALRPENGTGFYAYMSHGVMVAIFAPAFLLPLATLAVSLRAYWQTTGGGRVSLKDVQSALRSAANMRNLAGGHGEGCNFEDEDRFSQGRRMYHQATLFGFLLCFAATTSGTILHYGFGLQAPYSLISLPKLFGIPGGLLLCFGTAGLAYLKLRADNNLSATSVWGGEMAFVLLLFSVGATGLFLDATSGTAAVALLLPLHLGAVLTFFLLTPFSKMAHGFYRLAALTRDAANQRNDG